MEVNYVELKAIGGNMLNFWIRRIIDEFEMLLEEDKRIQEFCDKKGYDNVDFSVKTITISTDMSEQLAAHRGHLTRKFINDILKHYHHLELSSTFSIMTQYALDNDTQTLTIKGAVLIIRQAALARDIATTIHDLENMWKGYQWLLRHEMGHFIDHILNTDGITFDEFDKIRKECDDAYHRHDLWLDEYKSQPNYSSERVNRVYYNIPSEARANEYAGISVEDLIKLDREHDDKFNGKLVTMGIDVLKVENIPTEDERKHESNDGEIEKENDERKPA